MPPFSYYGLMTVLLTRLPHRYTATGLDCIFASQNHSSHQFLNWWQQMSPGHLRSSGFESETTTNKKEEAEGSFQ